MGIKKELAARLGYKQTRAFYDTVKRFKIDVVELFDVLEADTPLVVKRDYIYSIVSELIADFWWENYVDEYYFKRGGLIK